MEILERNKAVQQLKQYLGFDADEFSESWFIHRSCWNNNLYLLIQHQNELELSGKRLRLNKDE